MLQILEPFDGKIVLDLFSGSGILGIEALSRGSKMLISIENDKKIFKVLNNNLIKICKGQNYKAICMDTFIFLKQCNQKFDIIFSDPPYDKYDYLDIFNKSIPFINKGGVFCMEMRKSNVDLDIFRRKIYGNTQIILWEAS